MHNWKQERQAQDRTRSSMPRLNKMDRTHGVLAHEHNTPPRPILADPVRRMFEPGETPDC
jgi:hypothetical protein